MRLSRSFITDVPLALLALAAFALTLFASAGFALVLLGAGLAYELWTNASRWTRRAHSFALAPGALLAVTTGALTFSLTAEIFWEGLKAGLVTFGGAYTVIPYLHGTAVDGQHWLTEGEFVDGLAMGGVLPAPLIIFSTFVGYIAGGLGGGLAMTVGIFIPASSSRSSSTAGWWPSPRTRASARSYSGRRRRHRPDRSGDSRHPRRPASSTCPPRSSPWRHSSPSTAGTAS